MPKEYVVRSLRTGWVLDSFDSIEAALGFAYGWNHAGHSAPVEVVDSILLAGESPDPRPATLSDDNPERG